jgi:hypothetical protein
VNAVNNGKSSLQGICSAILNYKSCVVTINRNGDCSTVSHCYLACITVLSIYDDVSPNQLSGDVQPSIAATGL